MNWLRIDYRRLAMHLLPERIMQPKLIAILSSIMSQIALLHTLFISFRNDTDYKINHNSQVCYLQAVLNDNFDYINRRIYITDADVEQWTQFLWKESEDKPIMLGTFLLNRESFIGADSIDFVVHIPVIMTLSADDLNRMNSLIRYFKLSSKRYTIQRYE